MGPDSLASDAISVYSLSSIASSISFVSKPEGTSEVGGSRGHQDTEKPKAIYPQRVSLPQSNFSTQARAGPSKDEEEYEGFSIVSNEPLAVYQESPGMFSTDHSLSQTGEVRGSVNFKHSISSPNSPGKMTLIPSPNSPFQKVGKRTGSDIGESDHSSTETDSTVKSQEEGNGPKLDPQVLAQKILQETQSHLLAVEHLQCVGSSRCPHQPGRSSSLDEETASPSRVATFRSSETSAFSRPLCSSIKSQPSPTPVRPELLLGSSSLQTSSSGDNSPSPSKMSTKESARQLSLSLDSCRPVADQPVFRLKYPSSPYSAHISRSPQNISPSSGHRSPADSTPSPALSYSSASSARSSPANPPALDKLKMAAIDGKVQAIHNLKMFWQNVPQQPPGPMRNSHSSSGKASKRDVLSLLNLSPRRSKEEATDKLELKDLSAPCALLQKNSPNGRRPPADSSSALESSYPIRLPSGNGYKFLSPGRFFPSSKC